MEKGILQQCRVSDMIHIVTFSGFINVYKTLLTIIAIKCVSELCMLRVLRFDRVSAYFFKNINLWSDSRVFFFVMWFLKKI
jgi:hypothetical protein